ncbi:MAG: DUF1553 domain-containing protein [Zavarzinella sp.]
MHRLFSHFFLISLVTIASISTVRAVDFNREIKPILAKNCYACHGPDDESRAASLRLDQFADATKARKKGAAIVPKAPDKSRIIHRIDDQNDPMPPEETGNHLTPKEIQLLKDWIASGAEYTPHWAFVAPKKAEPITLKDPNWAANPVDTFVGQQLEEAGIRLGPPEDPNVLLRRLSLDIRGIPPSIEELNQFAADSSPDAYAKMVQQFLSSPRYGERWARVWLDLARYADSAGYGSDPLRLNMWQYRDWVIRALNDNLPYDQLTTWQLAGDLLPEPSMAQRVATAFHRNTMTNTEGGTDDEEFRIAAVKDRVDTTFQVWMGLSVGCAKCHNHKFDPVSQKEYYQLFAIFNQTADADRGDESPLMPVISETDRTLIEQIDQQVAAKQTQLKALAKTKQVDFEQWLQNFTAYTHNLPKSAHSPKLMPTQNKPVITIMSGPLQQLDGVVLQHSENAIVKSVDLETDPVAQKVKARKLRIEIPAKGTFLSLAEVQVLSGGKNVALTGTAMQSSTDYGGVAKRAIDGNTDGTYTNNSVSHTARDNNPWWEVAWNNDQEIDSITVWNRLDGVGDRLAPYRINLYDGNNKVIWSKDFTNAPNPKQEISVAKQSGLQVAEIIPGKYLNPPQPKITVVLFQQPLTIVSDKNLTIRVHATGDLASTVSPLQKSTISTRRALTVDLRNAINLALAQKHAPSITLLQDHFLKSLPEAIQITSEIARLEASKPKPTMLPIMQELPKTKQRTTKVMVKGDFMNLGEKVEPGLLSAFHHTEQKSPTRLELAQWLTDRNNPLTARVAVNRIWAKIFGQGLVVTEEDFGNQGDLPTHQKLLDWLAVEYFDSGWDTKKLITLLVTSSTYCQSSRVENDLQAKDPDNKLYWRSPRYRLDAETVRDQALALSGLLSQKIGGPSVYPPQPNGLWQAAFNGQRNYPTSMGEDRYRRGLYTIWRRTIPNPAMTTFDAPSREICSVRRIRTNTPLQAFVTLNDPVYVEAALGMAVNIHATSSDPKTWIQTALQQTTSRPATEVQTAALLKLYTTELERFSKDAEARKTWLNQAPAHLRTTAADSAQIAALALVCNVVLNLDAVLTR